MARFLYTVVFFLSLPLVIANLYVKGRDIPSYRKRWKEHFGILKPLGFDKTIWVHAVSVGESLAAVPIILRILAENPEQKIVVTTTTPTGAERIEALLGEQVTHYFSPYDYPWVVKRFIRHIRPKLTLIMETELWPNLIHFCKKNNIPVVVVNARLSDRSAKRYARLPIPTKKLLLDPISHFACQSESDAKRFRRLGAAKDKTVVTGSIKFDLQIPSNIDSQTRLMFEPWMSQPFIWVAGSTHVGEDEIILKAHKYLIDSGIDAKLIIVPRHPERFESVSELILQRGFQLAKRSLSNSLTNDSEVYICDSMGEMLFCYQAAHVAFVGGSLVERGGHNPLEAAALGKPVLTGKHIFNFADVFKNMFDAEAALFVDEDNLGETLKMLSENEEKQKQLGKAGVSVVESNRGAMTRTMKLLNQYLKNI